MAEEENGVALADVPCAPDDVGVFIGAWRGWRGDNVVPVRDQLNLRDIPKLLPRVIVMEVSSPTEARVRLAGTTYLDLFGMDLTGHNFVDLGRPEIRELRGRRLWAMVNRPCGSHAILPHPNPSKPGSEIHVLSLPVRPSDKTKPMQLFSISAASTHKVTPMDGARIEMVESLSEQFSFVDVGAGLPDKL